MLMSNYIDSQRNDYFRFRGVTDQSAGAGSTLPLSMLRILPASKDAAILDIGCGLGQVLKSLGAMGYSRLQGVDISSESVSTCRESGLDVQAIRDIRSFAGEATLRYDFIIMSHVLEHIDKREMIETLAAIRERLLAAQGSLYVIVPNAQAETGCYWAYEDFTHQTMFTSGSLVYVLKAAGFSSLRFVNPDGYEDYPGLRSLVKKCLLKAYVANRHFWRKVTLTQIHSQSPEIYTFELRVLASN